MYRVALSLLAAHVYIKRWLKWIVLKWRGSLGEFLPTLALGASAAGFGVQGRAILILTGLDSKRNRPCRGVATFIARLSGFRRPQQLASRSSHRDAGSRHSAAPVLGLVGRIRVLFGFCRV